MLLNDSKCKVLYIDNDPSAAPPHVTLNNKQLEVVDNYKYLGININTQLDPTDQWQRVQKRIGPAQYLLKQLKLDGFKEEILVTVFRSHLLSHISYGSPIFIAATANIMSDMQRAQTRALRIIGLNEQDALEKYNISDVTKFIQDSCVTTLRRILDDTVHPLTIKLTRKKVRVTRSTFRFEAPLARTETYNTSVVPFCVRVIRDGEAKLYNQDTMKELATKVKQSIAKKASTTRTSIGNTNKPKTSCKFCGNMYEAKHGIKIHLNRCKSNPDNIVTAHNKKRQTHK